MPSITPRLIFLTSPSGWWMPTIRRAGGNRGRGPPLRTSPTTARGRSSARRNGPSRRHEKAASHRRTGVVVQPEQSPARCSLVIPERVDGAGFRLGRDAVFRRHEVRDERPNESVSFKSVPVHSKDPPPLMSWIFADRPGGGAPRRAGTGDVDVAAARGLFGRLDRPILVRHARNREGEVTLQTRRSEDFHARGVAGDDG